MVCGNGPCLRIGVSEAAEGGRANQATCAVFAKAIGILASTVTIVLGQASRRKTLHILGDPKQLIEKLEKL